jgi:hypothetical protein
VPRRDWQATPTASSPDASLAFILTIPYRALSFYLSRTPPKKRSVVRRRGVRPPRKQGGQCERKRKSLLYLHHLRKRQQNESEAVSLDRVRGSSAIAAAARCVIGVWPDSTDPSQRFVAVIKSNLCAPPDMFISTMDGPDFPSFRVIPANEAPTAEQPSRNERGLQVVAKLMADGERHYRSELEGALTQPWCGQKTRAAVIAQARKIYETGKEGTRLWFQGQPHGNLLADG